jgi:catechol 2,3-dioxygenase-like lactoylglutathione lyase family enzyme
MNVQVKPSASKKLLKQLPQRLHHYAFVIRDHEANRQFFEGVLGIPLVATWCERAFNTVLGREIDYCHTFYEIGDGGALAFFQYADADAHEALKPIRPEAGQHIALKVTKATYEEILQRIKTSKLPVRETDHGYCQSMYVSSPDGLKVEFTVDPPEAAEISAMRRADCHSELARWLKGDHRPNNHDRHGVTA